MPLREDAIRCRVMSIWQFWKTKKNKGFSCPFHRALSSLDRCPEDRQMHGSMRQVCECSRSILSLNVIIFSLVPRPRDGLLVADDYPDGQR